MQRRYRAGLPNLLPSLLTLGLSVLVSFASASAAEDSCTAEVRILGTDGAAPRMALSLRLVDGAAKNHLLATAVGQSQATFEHVSCGPSAMEVWFEADPQIWALHESIRLRREIFEFDDRRRALLNVSVPAVRRVPCRVLDIEGKPVAGGIVEPFPRPDNSSTTLAVGTRISAEGTGVLLLTDGKYRLTYQDENNFKEMPSRINGVTNDSEFVVVGSAELSVEYVVERPASTLVIAGRVVDPEGTGIADIDIERSGARFGGTKADDNGSFEIRVRPTEKRVTLTAHDPQARWLFDPVAVEPRAAPERFSWVARPWPGPRLQGRVLAADTGEPIARVHIMTRLDCLEDPPGDLVSISTDAQGRFDMPCSEDCPATLDVYPYWSEGPVYFSEQEVPVPAGACGDSWAVRLERGSSVFGEVVDRHGHGVSGLRLKLERTDGGYGSEWTTGPDGSYSFHPLWRGHYSVRLDEMITGGDDRFFYLAAAENAVDPPPVIEVGDVQDVRVDLAVFRGGLLCAKGVETPEHGFPLPVTALHVVRAGDPGSTPPGRIYDLRHHRSADGGCTLGLPAGKWRFTATSYHLDRPLVVPGWFPTGESESPDSYAVTPGRITFVDPLPGQPAGGVTIDLADHRFSRDDRPAVEVAPRVEGRDEASPWVPVPPERVWIYTDRETGRFRLMTVLPPGTYDLRLRLRTATGEEAGVWKTESLLTAVGGERVEVTLAREPAP